MFNMMMEEGRWGLGHIQGWLRPGKHKITVFNTMMEGEMGLRSHPQIASV